MESACLRIKFTPLIQNLQKHSNQCLEIVPEITYIQNLDKIKWKEEENCIQYTVPITYKIILRKREIKYNDDLNRTYYSCVDLSFTSSDINLMKIGSATVKRTLSDTFILYDITTERENIILNSSGELKEDGGIIQKDTEIDNSACIVRKTEVNQSGLDNKQKVSVAQYFAIEIPDGTRSNLNTNDKHIKDETLTRDQVTNTDSSHENQFKSDCKHLDSNSKTWILRNKTNVKQQLCRTPICSVNTVDNTRNTKNYTELFLYEAIDFLRDINVYNRSNDNVYHTIQNDYLYYDIFNITTKPYKPLQDIQPLDNISTHRILPEVRVAKIVQQMEKEINPLKVMLNEIISKCSSLGLTKIKYQHSMFNNEINAEKEMNNVKSNRVVYSIVFDG